MAGPVLGFGQSNAYQNIQPSNITSSVNVRSVVPKEKEIQPQGTKLGGTEESNKNDTSAEFDAQLAAQQLLAQQQNVQRGSVIDVLI